MHQPPNAQFRRSRDPRALDGPSLPRIQSGSANPSVDACLRSRVPCWREGARRLADQDIQSRRETGVKRWTAAAPDDGTVGDRSLL